MAASAIEIADATAGSFAVEFARALAASETLDDVARAIVDAVAIELDLGPTWLLLAPREPGAAWPVVAAMRSDGNLPPPLAADDPLLEALRVTPAARPWEPPSSWATRCARLVAVPLVASSGLVGVLVTGAGEGAVADLELVASQAALAVDRAALAAEVRGRHEQGELLAEVAHALTSTLKHDDLLAAVPAQVRRLVACDGAALVVLDGDARRVVAVAGLGPAVDARFAGCVARRRAVVYCPDLATWTGDETRDLVAALRHAGLASAVVAPVVVGGAVKAELWAASTRAHAFDRAGAMLLGEIAPAVGASLRNAELFTQLERSYHELKEAQERLVRVERLRALGEMAAGVAHDFNNVLNAILHRTALLQARADDEARDGLRRIERAALRGAETVRRLQDFTQQRRDQHFAPVEPRAVVSDALSLVRPEAHLAPIRVSTCVDGNAPSVLGDHGELVEALANLVSNALDAMPGGGTLAVRVATRGDDVVFEVEDDGLGMDGATLERAFEPFFTTKGVAYAGLGLSVAYGIVKRHGGELAVESAPGRGTTARMRLARLDVAAAPCPPELAPARRTLAGMRVLLAEDDEVNREATRALLEVAGCVVTDVPSGRAAMEAFAPSLFDVVLSDLGMPDSNGWEVARYVKGRDPVPVALITGWGLTLSQDEGRARGVDVIIRKPVEPRRLLEVLASLVDR